MNESILDWSLLWSGWWDSSSGGKTLTSGTLHNRGELKLNFLPPNLILRGQVLDRRPLNFKVAQGKNWLEAQDFDKAVTHFQGALYHSSTGSRLLYGALDEWGLSARLRNPWIRSPPYAEKHQPLIADLKTAASSTKNDEVYLYLSTPLINISQTAKARGFALAQTEISRLTPAFAGGVDFSLPNKSILLMEVFHTWATLAPTVSSTWFSSQPLLPERDFRLYAAGLLFSNSSFSVSSDFALSETFAWGRDIYANLGISVYLPVPGFLRNMISGRFTRPLTISLAADGAGQRFVYRDGGDHGAAFRTALKTELKGARNSLLRFSTTLRGPDISSGNWDGFRRSSTNIYFRMPSQTKVSAPFRLTRISISADRNADNHLKITDRLYGYIGFSLKFPGINTPIGILLNGSVRGLTSSNDIIFPYPIPQTPWIFEDCAFYCEFSYSPSKYQFKTRIGYSNNAKNKEIWDFSISGAARFKYGRLSLKISSPELPSLWDFTISWRFTIN